MAGRKIKDDSLPKDRIQTDKSLGAERAKADESLLKGRRRTEQESNESVTTIRDETDEIKRRSRSRSDGERKNEISNSKIENYVGLHSSDSIVEKERLDSDKILELERRKTDAILDIERDKKEISERKLFHSEREETDKDLTNEREQTDIEVKRAKAALTTRDEFLAIVSHDLKNPLSAISFASDILISSETFLSLEVESKTILESIKRSASEALRLIQDLLDIERITSGRLGLNSSTVDLQLICKRSIELMTPQARSKGIILSFSNYKKPVSAHIDGDRILQVLSNLIGNAIKFTPSGGSIELKMKYRNTKVEISVKDSGPGICKDMHDKIFERFSQLEKQDRSGLGLGLYISKMIVESHQGQIKVDSNLGSGSTFMIILPLGK